jgi:xanthine dehydrogenase molybdopterin-binding subunit B
MEETGNLFMYFTQGVAATEVEVDTLTGDHTVLRVDIHVRTRIVSSLKPFSDCTADGCWKIVKSRH